MDNGPTPAEREQEQQQDELLAKQKADEARQQNELRQREYKIIRRQQGAGMNQGQGLGTNPNPDQLPSSLLNPLDQDELTPMAGLLTGLNTNNGVPFQQPLRKTLG